MKNLAALDAYSIRKALREGVDLFSLSQEYGASEEAIVGKVKKIFVYEAEEIIKSLKKPKNKIKGGSRRSQAKMKGEDISQCANTVLDETVNNVSTKTELEQAQEELEMIQSRLTTIEQDLTRERDVMAQMIARSRERERQIQSLTQQLNNLQEQQKAYWKDMECTTSKISELENEQRDKSAEKQKLETRISELSIREICVFSNELQGADGLDESGADELYDLFIKNDAPELDLRKTQLRVLSRVMAIKKNATSCKVVFIFDESELEVAFDFISK